MKGSAFVPGHITGFFEIHLDDTDPLKCGSRGAGFCVELGVRTEVVIEEAEKQEVIIRFNGVPAQSANTTRRVVDLMLNTQPYRVRIDAEHELPVSQGLGLSGAGALSTAVAIDKALGLNNDIDTLVSHAHRAEVECRTGLGDVIAQSRGGLEMRTAPGAPPHGKILSQKWETEVLLVVFEPPLTTRQVLMDPQRKEAINNIGNKLLEVFEADMNPPRFLKLSREFTIRSGLASDSIMRALRDVPFEHIAAMAMLGNCLFMVGEGTHKLAECFTTAGQCIETRVYNRSIPGN